MAPPAETADRSVIHDIGYQRYTGARLGRGFAVRSLYLHSLRAVFGLGRGAKAKIFPWMIIATVLVFALIVIVIRALSQDPTEQVVTYRGVVTSMAYPVMLFLAIIAPELVSRDLRDRVLPLYFARPLSRADYALTKLAALTTGILLLLGVPQLLIYLGAVFSRGDGFSGAWHELGRLLPGLGATATYALVLGGLSLLIASLTGRRAFAAAGVVAVFIITTPIVGILAVIGGERMRQLSLLANPMTATDGLVGWLFGPDGPDTGSPIGNFGPVYGIAVLLLVVVSVSLLLLRYRKVST